MNRSLTNLVAGSSISLVLLLSTVPVLALSPAGKPAEAPTNGNQVSVSPEIYHVTLITGDVVTVSKTGDGRKHIAISPAEPSRLGQHFAQEAENGDTYVMPDEFDLKKLDK